MEAEVCGASLYWSLTRRPLPSCLADYFSWPQVALTHHVCQLLLIRLARFGVKSYTTPGPSAKERFLSPLAARTEVCRAPALSNASHLRWALQAGLALALVNTPAPAIAATEIAPVNIGRIDLSPLAVTNRFFKHREDRTMKRGHAASCPRRAAVRAWARSLRPSETGWREPETWPLRRRYSRARSLSSGQSGSASKYAANA